jgi:prepilin-type N-terminal cleavage/methylation domain-containing protein
MNKMKNVLQRGFTAAELSAVAAIIAILALIVIPIFRDRVDEARRVGTLDDMQGLAKAILLANADAAIYPRLNDLDNGIIINEPAGDPSSEVPIGVPLQTTPLSVSQRAAVGRLWKGPYAAYQNSITIGELESFFGGFLSENNGPIRAFTPSNSGPLPINNSNEDFSGDRYPIDHYAQPYIYFPPGLYSTGSSNETEYANGIIYSFGPDGAIGDGIPFPGPAGGGGNAAANPLRRENGSLGTGDDLQYIF